MQRYKDISGHSGVTAYELGSGSITVQFEDGGMYVYDSSRPGARHVSAMKQCAKAGQGLATYINQHVRDNYARKTG